MMKSDLLCIVAAGILLLGLQAQALGGSENAVFAATGPRLLYVFSPSDDMHVQRALALPGWVANTGESISLVGVVRPVRDDAAAAVSAADQLGRRLTYPVVVPGELSLAGVPPGLLADIPADMDYVLLLTGSSTVAWTAPGEQLPSRLQAAQLSTDIDESTWGKIKELFQ
jgi:hypothetical protein